MADSVQPDDEFSEDQASSDLPLDIETEFSVIEEIPREEESQASLTDMMDYNSDSDFNSDSDDNLSQQTELDMGSPLSRVRSFCNIHNRLGAAGGYQTAGGRGGINPSDSMINLPSTSRVGSPSPARRLLQVQSRRVQQLYEEEKNKAGNLSQKKHELENFKLKQLFDEQLVDEPEPNPEKAKFALELLMSTMADLNMD